MKLDLKILTPRSFLPVAIGGVFAVVLVIVLVGYVFRTPEPVLPSPEEQADAYAKGQHYERGDTVVLDYAQALTWYHKAAEGGYAPAELEIGTMTMLGRGVVKDEKAAADWFRKAAEHDLPEAQVQYAGDLLSGVATADGKPDKVEAMKWLMLGAERMPDPLGRTIAMKTRDSLKAQLTPEEHDEADHRATEWRAQHVFTQ